MSYPIYTKQRDPDHGPARPLSAIRGYVMHYTFGYNAGDKATIGAHDRNTVSVHYFIADDDDAYATAMDKAGIYEFVPINVAANAVGTCIAGWGNMQTVSVEIGNRGNERPTHLQLQKLDWLIAHLDTRLGRKPPIKSHAEIALPYGRKAGDPNATFPLANYKTYRRHDAPAVPTAVVTTTTVVRASPIFGKITATLRAGNKVQVFEKSKWCSWWRIGYGTLRAWIPGKAIGK